MCYKTMYCLYNIQPPRVTHVSMFLVHCERSNRTVLLSLSRRRILEHFTIWDNIFAPIAGSPNLDADMHIGNAPERESVGSGVLFLTYSSIHFQGCNLD